MLLNMPVDKNNRTVVVVLLAIFCALAGRAATVAVRVDFFELSPNPVYIEENDIVHWYTDDPDSLFYVMLEDEFSPVPVEAWFPLPGTFNYTAGSAFGGQWQGSVIVRPNTPPTVAITAPTNNTSYYAPATFMVTAEASDVDPGDLWGVDFFVDGTLRGGMDNAPFNFTMTNLPAGTHTIEAVAWDHRYAKATNAVTVHVLPPPPIVLSISGVSAGKIEFSASELLLGRTNFLETATVLAPVANWTRVQTNVATSATAYFTNSIAPGQRYFRLLQAP